MAIKYEELQLGNQEQFSLKQLLEQPIIRVLEDETRYYVGIDSDEPSECWDVIDKRSKKLYWSTVIDMCAAGVFDEAKEITPEELKRALA